MSSFADNSARRGKAIDWLDGTHGSALGISSAADSVAQEVKKPASSWLARDADGDRNGVGLNGYEGLGQRPLLTSTAHDVGSTVPAPAAVTAAPAAAAAAPAVTAARAPAIASSTTKSTEEIWEERILQLLQGEIHGLHLSCVSWRWEEAFPGDPIDKYRPCKKMKDAVQKYVRGAVVWNETIFVVEELRQSADVLLGSQAAIKDALLRVDKFKAKTKGEKQLIREEFENAGWASWTARYQKLAESCSEDLQYRCLLECVMPASQSLDGIWSYTQEQKNYSFAIQPVGDKQLVFVEEINATPVESALQPVVDEADGCWFEASFGQADKIWFRLVDRSTLAVKCMGHHSSRGTSFNHFNAYRKLCTSYIGYGRGPIMAATIAMKAGLVQVPKAQPCSVPDQPTTSASRRSAKSSDHGVAPTTKSKGGVFSEAERLREELLQRVSATRQLYREGASEQALADSHREWQEALHVFLRRVERLLVGDGDSGADGGPASGAVPLSNPAWTNHEVLHTAWQYALALPRSGPVVQEASSSTLVRGPEAGAPWQVAIGRLAAALARASMMLGGTAAPARPADASQEAALESSAGTLHHAMPRKLWEDLIGRSVRSLRLDAPSWWADPTLLGLDVAEKAIDLLSIPTAPRSQHYVCHFLQLLFFERAAEVRERFCEARRSAEGRAAGAAVFQGAFVRPSMQHRPDLDVRLMPGAPRMSGTGLLRKGDLVWLQPLQPGLRRGEGTIAELRAEFDRAEVAKDGACGPPLKLKLWSLTLPCHELAKLLSAVEFTVQPLDLSSVTHDRQVEAVRAAGDGASSFHPVLRRMVIESWSPGSLEHLTEVPRCLASEPAELPKGAGAATTAPGAVDIDVSGAQLRAVDWASSRRCTIVRGPPGTGKTHTSCAIVGRWVGAGCRVLVVTQSNTAAENILDRLTHFGLCAVRLGLGMSAQDLYGQEYFRSLLDPRDRTMLEEAINPQERGEGSPRLPSWHLQSMLYKVAKQAPVVVMTCISSGNTSLLKDISFHRVLLDEAAQATEPTALVPLLTGAAGVACIGDDRQLPPTILSLKAVKLGLGKSLMERFLDTSVVSEEAGFVQLDIQRRMHESIMAFPSTVFYDGRVQTGLDDKDRPPIPGFPWPKSGAFRVCFVECGLGAEEQVGTSLQNVREADLLIQALREFLTTSDGEGCQHLAADDVAVITGYSAQRSLLRDKLRRLSQEQQRSFPVRVDTVDGFQGMERELVLVSTARSNVRGDVGFLRNPRRTNVLLTRAKRGLVVFGSWSTLKAEGMWSQWLDWVAEHGGYLSAASFQKALSGSA